MKRTHRRIGAIIREHRIAMDMKQDEMAKRLGIGQSQLSRIEVGQSPPDFDTLRKFLKMVNLDWAEVLGPTKRAS